MKAQNVLWNANNSKFAIAFCDKKLDLPLKLDYHICDTITTMGKGEIFTYQPIIKTTYKHRRYFVADSGVFFLLNRMDELQFMFTIKQKIHFQ